MIFIVSIPFIILQPKNCKSRKKLYGNKVCCNFVRPSGIKKVLEFHQFQKSDKASFIIYTELER